MYLKNKIIFGLSVLWIALFSFSACTSEKKEAKKNVNEISDSLIKNMSVGIAKTTQVRSEIKLTGKIVADQNKQIEVFALVSGTAKEVNVELGDFVQKDQILAVIRSGDVADY